jgi:carbon monoxide dehydrogenase subunit G
MPSVRVAKRIERKPEEIWPLLADAERWRDWMPSVESSRVTNDKEGLGRRQHLELSYQGYRGEIDLEITEWQPERRIAWVHLSDRIHGLNKKLARDVRTVVTLTPSGDGTEIAFDGSWEPVGLMSKMLGKTLIEGRAHSMFDTAAEKLERLATAYRPTG